MDIEDATVAPAKSTDDILTDNDKIILILTNIMPTCLPFPARTTPLKLILMMMLTYSHDKTSGRSY
jgi:hypothetical protein